MRQRASFGRFAAVFVNAVVGAVIGAFFSLVGLLVLAVAVFIPLDALGVPLSYELPPFALVMLGGAIVGAFFVRA